ncbi:MAG: restriction endonuclease [Gammaproteobacteria bacterium]|nr:restriction endonuclease [Gammaproteobacteria bacterium]
MKLDQILQMLDTQMEVAKLLEESFRSFYNDESLDDASWLSLSMASKFLWLHEVFSALWDKNIAFEEVISKYRPQYGSFSPSMFEEIIQAAIFIVLGKYFDTTKGSHDEGIDLILSEEVETTIGIEYTATSIVQCKLYRNVVPVSELRDFFGVMVARAATGYFFTTASFTKQAVEKFMPLANSSSLANKLFVVADKEIYSILAVCNAIASEVVDSYLSGHDADIEEIEENRQRAKALMHSSIPIQQDIFERKWP